jgi:hypothetical protein
VHPLVKYLDYRELSSPPSSTATLEEPSTPLNEIKGSRELGSISSPCLCEGGNAFLLGNARCSKSFKYLDYRELSSPPSSTATL